MTPPKQPLLAARESAGLSIEEMALLVGLESSQLTPLERGTVYPRPEIVERYATVLGLSVRDLLAGEEPTAVAVLFRRMSRECGPFVEAIDAGLAESLGGFVRDVREIARLRALLTEGTRTDQLRWLEHFKPISPAPRPNLYAQTTELASSVREFLGLEGDEEIKSMRALVEQLGIVTVFADPDQVDRDIDGASLLSPHPAILVNLVGGGDKYWRTRMTLAHELCHMLFDRAELDPTHPRKFFIFSPKRSADRQQPAWHLFNHFDDLEARANAFAGEFLAPTSGIRRLISARDPGSPEAVAALIAHYKIGKETAVNRLTNTFKLSEAQRRQMLARPTREARGTTEHPDTVAPGSQSCDESFVSLVMQAFARAKIDAIEARSLLHLRLSDPLPDHEALRPAQRAPLRSRDVPARIAAEDHLHRHVGLEYFVSSVEQVKEGWRAQVHRRERDGGLVEVAALLLGTDLTILDDASLLAAIA